MNDFLIRGVIKPLNIRYVFVRTTDVVTTGIKCHDTDPISSTFLSQGLTIGSLLTPLLEAEEEYSLRWEYNGLLKTMIVNAHANGDVRGYMLKPHLAMESDDRIALFGESGSIGVIKSSNGEILNSGVSEAGLLDIPEDMGFFFSTSDQIETQIAADIRFNSDPSNPVKCAAGFMLQAMPECDLEKFDRRRQKMIYPEFLDTLLENGLNAKEQLRQLITFIDPKLSEDDYTVAEGITPVYRCKCSREKMLNAVRLLKKKELEEMFKENNAPRIRCQFCGEEYSFSADDLNITVS